ncbi:MAG: bifunctional glutamate N-acetyltransferase/amino-acid acetyltransferase ArgJ [Bacteroidota bacterium]|jgi:glutamate N-acetyltransferase/amino-acid N-acetyltransferase
MTNGHPDGVTAAKGFQAAGVHCGLKKMKKDLALLYSTVPAVGAGIFTTSKVQAAPVMVDKMQFRKSTNYRAIVVNSGNANACTGERGLNDAWSMVKRTAEVLKIGEDEILVSSTGVIGQYMPMEKISAGITEASLMLGVEGHASAAEAIMTTDTFPKEYVNHVNLNGIDVTIGGMAKGSGMIAPNMATMLAFITTDVNIAPDLLQFSLKQAADHSFNRITVDGDTSTNDMVLILANGSAGNEKLTSSTDPSFKLFHIALEELLVRLSKMIVLDGEGATKFVEIIVSGAASEQAAVQAARATANSSLVKTAIHGEDANWGRILAAIGYSGIEFNPADVEIFFGEVPILRRDYRIDFSEAEAKRVLSQKEIRITIDLHQGDASATFWTCDLSKEYVAINSNYRT